MFRWGCSSLRSAPPDEIYRMVLLSSLRPLIKPAVLTRCHGQNRNVGVLEPPQLFFVWNSQFSWPWASLLHSQGVWAALTEHCIGCGHWVYWAVACSGSRTEQFYLVVADSFLCACIIRVINWVCASKFQEPVFGV